MTQRRVDARDMSKSPQDDIQAEELERFKQALVRLLDDPQVWEKMLEIVGRFFRPRG